MMRSDLEPRPEDLEIAHRRLAAFVTRTPVVRCEAEPEAGGGELHLKLENLQPIGSFKLRPIGNAVLSRPKYALANGLYAASSGNSAVAVAWMARRLGVPATAYVPPRAPAPKLELLARYGASVVELPFDEWWATISRGRRDGARGLYVEAARDPAALAGNASVGLEILEQLPDVDAIYVPFGGGALACGIALALRARRRDVRVIACELETAQPARAARLAGGPVEVPHAPGFVSGIGYGSVLPEMWPLVRDLIDDVQTVSLDEVARAIRALALRNCVIAEGAGAVPVAAALYRGHAFRRPCAVVSGGNLGAAPLAEILAGRLPAA